MKSKIIDLNEALNNVKDGSRIMIGGFIDVGSPIKCIEEIANRNIGDLTLIAITPGMSDFGKAILYKKGLVKELISSHVGTCQQSTDAYLSGNLYIEQFFPMGTLVEKIHAGAVGLSGILVPVGVGILDEEGLFPNLKEKKETIEVNGVKCFIEPAINSEITIIRATRGDAMGNLEFSGTTQNNNLDMAMAGKYTIAEVGEIVEVGEIEPSKVGCPGVFVDAVVKGYSKEEHDDLYRNIWTEHNKLFK